MTRFTDKVRRPWKATGIHVIARHYRPVLVIPVWGKWILALIGTVVQAPLAFAQTRAGLVL